MADIYVWVCGKCVCLTRLCCFTCI